MATAKTLKYLPRNAPISIINAAFGNGSVKAGAECAPSRLLSAGIGSILSSTGRQVTSTPSTTNDFHHLRPPIDPKHRNMNIPRWASAVTKALSDDVYTAAIQGHQVLTLGGDHSIAIGTLTGITRALRHRFGDDTVPGVIYIDAHADINVPEDSISGNVHGMSLAWASGLARSTEVGIFDWISQGAWMDLSKLVYIGLRDVDEAERCTIKKRGIKTFWAEDVRYSVGGIEKVVEEALGWLGDATPLYISFDIDGLDPVVAPSTSLPVSGGLNLQEGVYIMNAVRQTGRLVGMDLVEVNPKIGSEDDAEMTVNAGIEVVKAGLAA